MDLLDLQYPKLEDLIKYSKKVARALSVVLGPVYMELIWGNGGLVMIKAGTWLPGVGLPSLYSKVVYNADLLSAVVCTYLDVKIPLYGSRECLGRIVYVVSEAECEFPGLKGDDLKRLQTLESYWGYKLYI